MAAYKHGGQWYIIASMSISTGLLRAMNQRIFCLIVSIMWPAISNAQLTVITSIRPLQLIGDAIVGERGRVTSLVGARQSPHHYSMSPSDRIAIARADLLIWIDPTFEIYLSDIFPEQARTRTLITVSQLTDITLAHDPTGLLDPHLWLDPKNALLLADVIAAKASALDPPNSEFFQLNLQRFRSELMRVDGEIADRLQAPASRGYGVYHDAFRYFENRYGLSHQLVLLRNPEREPNVQEIIAARRKIADLAPYCLFIEPDSSQAVIDTMLGGYKARQITVDLLGDLSTSSNNNYAQLLTNLTNEFEQCVYQ